MADDDPIQMVDQVLDEAVSEISKASPAGHDGFKAFISEVRGIQQDAVKADGALQREEELAREGRLTPEGLATIASKITSEQERRMQSRAQRTQAMAKLLLEQVESEFAPENPGRDSSTVDAKRDVREVMESLGDGDPMSTALEMYERALRQGDSAMRDVLTSSWFRDSLRRRGGGMDERVWSAFKREALDRRRELSKDDGEKRSLGMLNLKALQGAIAAAHNSADMRLGGMKSRVRRPGEPA